MSQLWRRIEGHWHPLALDGECHLDAVTCGADEAPTPPCPAGDPVIHPHESPTGSTIWVLLAPHSSEVQHNDNPLETGVRVLADRDAIRVRGYGPLYFSSERLAEVQPFPGAPDTYCPRCKLLIDEGDDAVRCVQCDLWHHESHRDEKRRCWTYSKTCSLCDQPTELDNPEFRWTPSEL